MKAKKRIFRCCEICSPEGHLVGVDDCPHKISLSAGREPECQDCHLAFWEESPDS